MSAPLMQRLEADFAAVLGAIPKPEPLEALPLDELEFRLRRQTAPVVSTWGMGVCGHFARGSGVCADCLRAEIERRNHG